MRTHLKLAASLAAALAIAACSEGGSDAPTAQVLDTASINMGSVTKVVGATGKIVPRDEIMVGSEVSGRVTDVLVDFNSRVTAGQVLARIDPTNFQNAITQLDGRIASAEADIEVQRASIDSAEVSLAQAELNLDRQSGLFAQQAVSEARLETAKRDVGVARANLNLARARLQSQEASLKQVQAQMQTARENLRRTTIISPIDGVVIDRKIDPGQTVQASFSAPELFAIAADLSEIEVQALIVESDVAGLEPGDPARFTVDAYPDMPVEGKVEQLRLKSETNNNIVSYVAVVTAPNPDGKLMPGMTANMEITTAMKPRVARLPVTVERFRPSPAQLAQFEGESDSAEAPTLLDPTFDRLRVIGVEEGRIQGFKGKLEPMTKGLRDIINDPTKSFMHTPMKINLGELVEAQVKTFLDAEENQKYAAQIAQERTIRPVEVWVATPDGKMVRRTVKLGLSDGAFVELVSGLEEGETVVTGVKAAGGGQGRGGRPGGRPGGSRR